MLRLTRRPDPSRVYLGSELALSLLLAVAQTTVIVYWVASAHLDPLRLLLLGTTLEGAYLLFQLPTGALADLASRRACVVAGIAVVGVSYGAESLTPAFWNLLAAQVGVALGAALLSGAQEAWIADELPDVAATHLYVRATQLGLVGTIAGSLASGALMLVGRNVPLLAGGAGLLALAGALAAVMPERDRGRPPLRLGAILAGGGLVRQGRAASRAVRAAPGLVLLFAMTVFLGMWSESFDRLWGDFFLTDVHFPAGLDAGLWFSLIAVAASGLALVTTGLVKWRLARAGDRVPAPTLGVLLGVTGVAVAAMARAGHFGPALAAYLVVAALRPTYQPLLDGWTVTQVDPAVRATALSAQGMCDSGGQIAGGPVFGLIGTLASIRVAILAGAALLLPAIGLLAAAGRAPLREPLGAPPRESLGAPPPGLLGEPLGAPPPGPVGEP